MDEAEQELFRQFVGSRSAALLRSAVLLAGGDRHAGEDLLQGALLKASSTWKRLDNPEAFVRKVMYRQQISTWRRLRTRRETTVAELPDTAVPDGTGEAEQRLLVRQALSALTARQRTVLVLHYYEDHSESEVAELLGCSVGTVRSTAHRSLAKLRKLAPDLGGQFEAAEAPEADERVMYPAEVTT
jgi:RNA polymerase sigma-70 factor (sigma-E family)